MKFIKPGAVLVFVALLLCGFALTPTHAMTFPRNNFDTAFPDATRENWDAFPDGTTFPNGITINGITYNSSSGIAIVTDAFGFTTAPNSLGRTPIEFFAGSDTITFTFNVPISAFGIDINTFDTQDGGYTASTDQGEVFSSVFDPFPRLTTGQFLGFSTEMPLTSVTIAAPGGNSYTVDSMRFFVRTDPPSTSCDCNKATITGTNGNDKLIGTPGDDIICGFGGNDRMFGEGGHDCLDGGSGNDLLFEGDGHDLLLGRSGNDRLYGEAGNDTLNGNIGDDVLQGGAGEDRLLGESGNDDLRGDAGGDDLSGGSGHDTLRGGSDHDVMNGDGGDDFLRGNDGNDVLWGGSGEDVVDGDRGDDNLSGGQDGDIVKGDDGNDFLFGNSGDDMLRGGAGEDRLSAVLARMISAVMGITMC